MLSDSTLGEFFRAAIDIPEIPFGEMLWESAQRFPEKVALVFQGQKISYRELDGLANSCANALAKLGVKKGDRVALYMTNRPEYIISVYGIARLGAVFTPMNPTYRGGNRAPAQRCRSQCPARPGITLSPGTERATTAPE